jgi:TM2 domain-containing membrane protein YozV
VPEDRIDTPRFCPRCGQPIVVSGAIFCKDCGASLTLPPRAAAQPFYVALAAFALSFIPGLGHLYRGRLGRAMLWFLGVAVAYTLAYPLGLMVHFICALNAALTGAVVAGTGGVARTGPRA